MSGMMQRRRVLGVLAGAPCVLASRGSAQQPLRRIGFLANLPPSRPEVAHLWEAVTQTLHERGYVEGRNVVFERRYVEGQRERIPQFAADLVKLDCDVIAVSIGDESIRALKKLTSTIPTMGVDLIRIEMAVPEGFVGATSAILRERGEAFIVATNQRGVVS